MNFLTNFGFGNEKVVTVSSEEDVELAAAIATGSKNRFAPLQIGN